MKTLSQRCNTAADDLNLFVEGPKLHSEKRSFMKLKQVKPILLRPKISVPPDRRKNSRHA